MPFILPKLPYELDALEPHIDALTMSIHHSKHHQAYINNLNNAIVGTPSENFSIDTILANVDSYSEVVRNNGGGYYNHSFFWETLSPKSTLFPKGILKDAIIAKFESFESFKNLFSSTATSRFGSGWAWLYLNKSGELSVCSTANQDNPLMNVLDEEFQGIPILGLDVWEHAYYLKYYNLRAKYIEAFWNIINWDKVEERYEVLKNIN